VTRRNFLEEFGQTTAAPLKASADEGYSAGPNRRQSGTAQTLGLSRSTSRPRVTTSPSCVEGRDAAGNPASSKAATARPSVRYQTAGRSGGYQTAGRLGQPAGDLLGRRNPALSHHLTVDRQPGR
jgi:hypothetical protein